MGKTILTKVWDYFTNLDYRDELARDEAFSREFNIYESHRRRNLSVLDSLMVWGYQGFNLASGATLTTTIATENPSYLFALLGIECARGIVRKLSECEIEQGREDRTREVQREFEKENNWWNPIYGVTTGFRLSRLDRSTNQ